MRTGAPIGGDEVSGAVGVLGARGDADGDDSGDESGI
jgi:hypothetical protein